MLSRCVNTLQAETSASSALTYARVSSTLTSDLFRSLQFEWLFPLVQGDRQHPGERVVRSHSRYLRFFSLFFSTRPKEFF